MKKQKINTAGSRSLWNYTLSPGWTKEEVDILKLALQKFGIGRWKRIIDSICLPGKQIGQIYLQTQRIMGQQSLGNYMGLHIDIEKVFIDNINRTGVERKNNCVINTGDNPTRQERTRCIAENKDKYGLTKECVQSIRLPKTNNSQFKDTIMLEEIETNKFSTIEKIHHLIMLKKAVQNKVEYLAKRGVEEQDDSMWAYTGPGACVTNNLNGNTNGYTQRSTKMLKRSMLSESSSDHIESHAHSVLEDNES